MTHSSNEAKIHPQLTILMELQDMRAQRRELLGQQGGAGPLEEEHFHIDLDAALAQLDEKLEELEEGLTPPVRARYRQILPNRDRVVVPVINGVCYGCFVSIPTATAGDLDVHQELQRCESCGCFIYVLP